MFTTHIFAHQIKAWPVAAASASVESSVSSAALPPSAAPGQTPYQAPLGAYDGCEIFRFVAGSVGVISGAM